MISDLYAAIVRRRREYYAARPHLRRRLRRPVISIGNLAVGGRGKTPLVGAIARMLLEMGERPAILSRGYARRRPADGVVVVRDPDGMRADLDRAGDEPLMLARQLPDVSVLVSPDRYLAGCLAEQQFGATVHVLDDGFQHLQLDRDIDLVIVGRQDVERPVTLPGGRLREPLDTLVAADAVLTADPDVRIDVVNTGIPVFRLRRTVAAPSGACEPRDRSSKVLALAGIASPQRFFDDLTGAGWQVAETLAFRDHHPYSRRDLERIRDTARSAGAAIVLTTEKDYVRLLPLRPFGLPVCWVPLTMEPDPRDEFQQWLDASLRAARDIVD